MDTNRLRYVVTLWNGSSPDSGSRSGAVRAINDVVSAYYAEKTAKVLQQVQDVLSRLTAQ